MSAGSPFGARLTRLLGTIGVRGVCILGTFVFNMMVGRLLGPEALGAFSFAISIVMLALVAAKFGGDRTMAKAMAGAPNTVHVRRRLGVVALRAVVLALLLWGAAWAWQIARPQDALQAQALGILALVLPPLAVTWIASGYFNGLGRSAWALFFQNGGMFLIACLLLFAGLGVTRDWRMVDMAWLVVAAAAMMCSLALLAMRFGPAQSRKPAGKAPAAPASARYLFLVEASSVLMQSGMFIVAAVVVDALTLGHLRAAERLALLVAVIISITNVMVLPRIVQAHQAQDVTRLRRPGHRAVRLNLAFGVVPCLILLAVPEVCLGLFGAEFSAAAPYLRIMAAAQLINIAAGPAALYLSMTGHEKQTFQITLGVMVLSLGAYLGAGALFGGIGVAIAYAAVIVLKNGLMLWMVKRRLGVWYLW